MAITSRTQELIDKKRKENAITKLPRKETNGIRKRVTVYMKNVKRVSKILEHEAKLELKKVVLTS